MLGKLISEYFMKYLYVKCSYGLDIYNFSFTCDEQTVTPLTWGHSPSCGVPSPRTKNSRLLVQCSCCSQFAVGFLSILCCSALILVD